MRRSHFILLPSLLLLLAAVLISSSENPKKTVGTEGANRVVEEFRERDPKRPSMEGPALPVSRLRESAVGQRVALPFKLGNSSAGKVTMSHETADGRVSTSILLDDGETLFLTSLGERWEGRIVPKHRGRGWRLEGDENGSFIREVDVDDLICSSVGQDGEALAGLPVVSDPVAAAMGHSELAEAAEPAPILNSLPGAAAVIYLDFDGETVSGTQWNSSYTAGEDIIAGGAPFSAEQITMIWATVSEDYAPFQINVTTDRSVYENASVNRRTMVIFTPDNSWYGVSGGVAYVDVFGSSLVDPPAWVFTSQLGGTAAASAANSAEAASHEAGHTLGLHHDGDASGSYHTGNSSWAPIMGAAYYAATSQWSKGEYTGANNQEDDLAIISSARNGFGYRSDDHSNSIGGASTMATVSQDTFEAEGRIERSTDTDVFVFQTSGGNVQVTADNATVDPDLDIRLSIFDTAGVELAVSDPTESLDATLSTTLAAGTYYVAISGTGNGTAATGYSDYASLGVFSITAVIPQEPFALAAEIVSPFADEVSLPFGTGLILDGLVSGGSPSWEIISSPDGAVATFSSPDAVSTDVIFSSPGVYVIEFKSHLANETASDTLTIAVEEGTYTFADRAPRVSLDRDQTIYDRQVILSPIVDDDGPEESLSFSWTLVSGPGQLTSTTSPNPRLEFLSPAQSVRLRLVVDDGMQRGFAEGNLTADYQSVGLVQSTSDASVWVASSAPPEGWATPDFDVTTWQSGQLGVGYDTTPGGGPKSPPRQIFNPEIGDGLNVEASMNNAEGSCYLRIPFNLMDPASVISLTLRMKFDDGFVAYINGVEIARDNVGPGTPSWNDRASSDRPDEEALSFRTFAVSLPSGALVSGTNILAIQGLNFATGNQDRRFLLSPELEGVVGGIPIPPPSLTPFESSMARITDEALRGPDDDPDGDGLTNLTEHALGTAPESANPPLSPLEATTPGGLLISLPDPQPEDVVYCLEHTTDLEGDWGAISDKAGTGPWSGEGLIGLESFAEGEARFMLPVIPESRGFFRLRMELLTP